MVRVVLPSCGATGAQAKAINSKRVTGANFEGDPGRGLSCSPRTPWGRNRARQRSTIRGWTPRGRATAVALPPSSEARKIRARNPSR